MASSSKWPARILASATVPGCRQTAALFVGFVRPAPHVEGGGNGQHISQLFGPGYCFGTIFSKLIRSRTLIRSRDFIFTEE